MPAGLEHAFAQARDMALHTLTDTVTIDRASSSRRDKYGTRVDTTSRVWEGHGLTQVRQTTITEALTDTPRGRVDVTGWVVKLPTDCPVEAGDLVTVTSSMDARQVGRVWRILTVPVQGWAVLRRCPADLVEDGEL